MTVGGCAAYREDALEAVGLFDPMFRYCDDIAVSLRLYQRGHLMLRDPAFWVKHHIDTCERVIWKKDLCYCRDAARITKRIMGRRLSLDMDGYRAFAGHVRSFLATGERYHAFEARRRRALRLATALFGLLSGCIFL